MVKIIVILLVLLFLYGFARPLGVYSYCKITAGSGPISPSQILDPEPAKALQDKAVKDCTSNTMAALSIPWLDKIFPPIATKIGL